MFDDLKNRISEDSVFFERLRTLLYLSKNKKIGIWVVLWKDGYIDSAKIESAVVRSVYNGNPIEPLPSHKRNIGGKFTFEDSEHENIDEFHNMEEIYAVSFHPIKTIPDDLKKFYCLNRVQHLCLSADFMEGRDNASHYYRILFAALGKNTV